MDERCPGAGSRHFDSDPAEAAREEVALALEAANGYTMVPPYDHEEVVAGQGTAALEFFEEVGDLDILLVPCGGGGLLSGSAIAAAAISTARRCRLCWTPEPAGWVTLVVWAPGSGQASNAADIVNRINR